MFLLAPLRHRPIALLWGGQVLSAIGDEVYKVALVWLAVGLIGTDAGYLSALQAASVFFFGLLGGVLADRWNHRRTMMGADIIRTVTVLLPPIVGYFRPITLWVLVPVAVIVSSLSAFFDPALQATLPELTPAGERGRELMQAANGLVDSTRRFARVVGPGLIGVLNGWLPILHFFTLDSVSFACSAAAVGGLGRYLPKHPRRPISGSGSARANALESVFGAVALVRRQPLMRFALVAKAVLNGTWNLGFALGMALLVHQRMPGNIGAYGAVMASYGVGNLAATFLVGSLPFRHPARMLFGGIVLVGVGLVGIAVVSSLPVQMMIAAVMAAGGPMSDVSFLLVLQHCFRVEDIARIYRLRMTGDNAFILFSLLASPWLFRHLPIPAVIGVAGLAVVPFGLFGLFRFWDWTLTERTAN